MEDQLRKGQPNSTEEVKVGKSKKIIMGKPDVIMFEEGESRKGRPNSNEEVKGGEKQR